MFWNPIDHAKRVLLTLATVSLLSLSPASLALHEDDLLAGADEVLAEVSRLRDLPVLNEIAKGVTSRGEIRNYLLARIEDEYPAERIAIDQKVLAKLGLISQELNLHDFLLELLTEQVAGYYDPKQKRFYIADWLPLESQAPVMAHELTHALQDQHFGLDQFLKPIEGNDDETLARSALIEGEGVAIMMDYLLMPMGQSFLQIPDPVGLNQAQGGVLEKQFKVFASAPTYLKEVLLFPYSYGAGFVKALRQRYSWSEIAKVYEDLPRSTEQILHPEKYLDLRDEPREVPAGPTPEFLNSGWSRIYSNVLGEFSFLLLFREFLDERLARQASKGWGGDRIELYEAENGRLSLLMRTVWDSEKHAAEFFSAYLQLLEAKYAGLGNSQPQLSESDPENGFELRKWLTPRDRISIYRRGDFVEVQEFELSDGLH